MTVSNI